LGYRELGQHSQAKECNEKALSVRRNIYGEEHQEAFDKLQQIAIQYKRA